MRGDRKEGEGETQSEKRRGRDSEKRGRYREDRIGRVGVRGESEKQGSGRRDRKEVVMRDAVKGKRVT